MENLSRDFQKKKKKEKETAKQTKNKTWRVS